jgi:RNA polymerase-binding transcription factor
MANLTEQQLAELRRKLKHRRDELQEEIRQELIRSDDEHYIDLAGRVHDVGEQSVADMLSDFQIAIIDRQLNELREVEGALQRMAMGTYGVCFECRGDISYERLLAQPTATRDVVCQEMYEKTHANEGGPTL